MDRGYIPVINIGGFERYVHAVEKECKRYGVPAPDRAEIVEYAQTCMCKRVFEAWRQDELETMQQIEAENAAGVKSDIESVVEDMIARILREMFGVSEFTWLKRDLAWDNFLEFLKTHSVECSRKEKTSGGCNEWMARFKVWAVYETESPEDGFEVVIAVDEEDAKRQAVLQHGGTITWWSAAEMMPRVGSDGQVEYVVQPTNEDATFERIFKDCNEEIRRCFNELMKGKADNEFLDAAETNKLIQQIYTSDEKAIQRMIETLNNKTDIQKDTSSEAGDPDGQPCPEDP